MRDEKQRMANAPEQVDPELVSAMTVSVVQSLQAMGYAQQPEMKKTEKQDAPKTIDLVGLVFHILEKFWLVVLLAVVCAGAAGLYARRAVPTYTATAKLYIVNPNSNGINIADLQLGTVLTLDYQEVFKTWEVHEMVREELNLPYSYQQMQSLITVTNPEDTRLLYIYATYPDAQIAADIANAYAKAAKTFIINTMRGEEPSDFSIALVPSTAQAVSKTGTIIKGFLLGTILAIGILTLMFVLDDRPRTPDDIENYAGIPTLAVLPSVKDARKLMDEANQPKTQGGGNQYGKY